jgi:hypothetical protein
MTAEQFVKAYYPNAKSHNSKNCYGQTCKHLYTYITALKDGFNLHLGDGDNESKAWNNVKRKLKDNAGQ